ncbi:hypothetical protein, partial [Pelagovum pacificum]|uniref:hypothetical protein n=1 Tax=Pelagovum pacificum TaxID=2588711 RepID=UPI001E2944EC
MNQTAHISLQILAISKSVEAKSDSVRPNFSARPASITSGFLLRLVGPGFRRRPVWRPVSASAPPVKGYLRFTDLPRKWF